MNRLPVELRKLKRRTGWSWEKMNREFAQVMFAQVMGEDGPSHTTLFRIASGRSKAQEQGLGPHRYLDHPGLG